MQLVGHQRHFSPLLSAHQYFCFELSLSRNDPYQIVNESITVRFVSLQILLKPGTNNSPYINVETQYTVVLGV